jgi:hypothetical protein
MTTAPEKAWLRSAALPRRDHDTPGLSAPLQRFASDRLWNGPEF